MKRTVPPGEPERPIVIDGDTKLPVKVVVGLIGLVCAVLASQTAIHWRLNKMDDKAAIQNWRLARIEIKLGIADIPPLAQTSTNSLALAP
jgi:hypothetical protein